MIVLGLDVQLHQSITFESCMVLYSSLSRKELKDHGACVL